MNMKTQDARQPATSDQLKALVGDVLASAWALAGAEWNGRDVIASGLEVTGDRNITGLIIKMMVPEEGDKV